MEATKRRHIKAGYEYDNLFPLSQNENKTIKPNANLEDTLSFIPKVVNQTLDQTKKISLRLKGRTTHETCKNIWQFVYGHINYKKDEDGTEQIRSPSRTWHDRQQGVDCDCYSVFISSILTNLGISHILRIAKYHRDYFQHIYPIVPNQAGHITMDCVTDWFNHEVTYREKKDYPMDLQYLNGFDGDGLAQLGRIIERNMHDNTLAGKAKRKAKKATKAAAKVQAAANPGAPAPKKKGFFKKVLNVVNKVNPVTVLLRNGVLAAMKLNIKNVAARLRWSYLTAEQAAAKGIDTAKHQKLVATRQKLENIFYGAGGKPDNLRKAILGGKGNKDKAVSGLGMLPMANWSGYMNENTPLQQLLGREIYFSENVDGMDGFQGFGQLGEPITLASVGAAMGVLAGIVASLKQIGNIFKSKQPGSEDFDESQTEAPENNVSVPTNATVIPPAPATNPIIPNNNVAAESYIPTPSADTSVMTNDALVKTSSNVSTTSSNREMVTEEEFTEEKTALPTANNTNTSTSKDTTNSTGDEKQSFWDKNKKWLKPVAIGVGGLTVIAIAYKLSKGSNKQNKASPKSQALSGAPHKRKKKKKPRSKHPHKKAIVLL